MFGVFKRGTTINSYNLNSYKMKFIKLTLLDLKKMRRESLIAELYQQQDWACNIDYIKNPIESDIVHSNITLIESILIYKEH